MAMKANTCNTTMCCFRENLNILMYTGQNPIEVACLRPLDSQGAVNDSGFGTIQAVLLSRGTAYQLRRRCSKVRRYCDCGFGDCSSAKSYARGEALTEHAQCVPGNNKRGAQRRERKVRAETWSICSC